MKRATNKELLELKREAEIYPDPPANIGEAIKNKFKVKTARLFTQAARNGSYPITNQQFNRICRAFEIKTK